MGGPSPFCYDTGMPATELRTGADLSAVTAEVNALITEFHALDAALGETGNVTYVIAAELADVDSPDAGATGALQIVDSDGAPLDTPAYLLTYDAAP